MSNTVTSLFVFATFKYSHPIQPITYHSNTYLVPVFCVSLCFMYLCAYVLLCFMRPCVYTIHFYALHFLCLYTLHPFVCVNMSGLVVYTTYFKKCSFFCNTSISFLSGYFSAMVSLSMLFSAFISLMCKSPNILRIRKRYILKISFCF